ncbi:M48 family metallopeptidase [Pseudothioglobus sp. nBUS_23]|uniref:M48 family metallopeptidase n=1 Tax=Pseudothioglobus sp. nBUS_23 TaxID=3395318 RepID=UPI003EBE6ECA
MPEHGSINYIHMNPNKIIRSKRKTLSLTINENAELIIRAPKRLSIEKIQDFINEKENWINRKKRLIENQIKDVTSNHNKLLYLGTLFPINVEQNASKELFFTGEEFIANSIEPDSLSLSIKKWYKNKFKEIALPRVAYFANKHNLMVNQVRIKNQKTMWGSCSSKNNINLNYLLLMAPMGVIDYVIVHELVHTIHRNHSTDFWDSVESIMPEFQEHKRWLKKNGYKLRRI